VGAELTVLFTDVDGFQLDGRRVDEVAEITPAIERAAGPGTGSGGMTSKLRAAAAVTRAGGSAVIAHGKRHSVAEILSGAPVGTWFPPRGTLDPRSRWLQALKEEGRLAVDAGSVTALRDNGRSLLPVGIVSCDGEFEAGAAVLVSGPAGPVAKGLVNFRAHDLRRIQGRRSAEIAGILGVREFDEVIHRDNLVLL
jgi:glutamate 5-kinase